MTSFVPILGALKGVLSQYGSLIAIVAGGLAVVLAIVIGMRMRKKPTSRLGGGATEGRADAVAYDAAMNNSDFQAAALIARRMHDNRRYAEAVERSGDLERAVQAWYDAKEPLRAATLVAKAGHFAKAGRLFLDLGATREALDCFIKADDLEGAARVVERQGDLKKANLLRGEALQRRGEYADAAARFLDAQDPLRAAQALEAAGDRTGAVGLYRQAGKPDEAARLVATDDPKTAAELYEQGGRFDEAARLWLQLGETAAFERALSKAGHAFDAGRSAFERKDFKAALAYFDTLDSFHPNYREAQLFRGQIFERRGDLEPAGDAYFAFIEGRPPSDRTKPLFLRVAQIKEGCGQAQTALKVLGRLITAGLGTPDVTAHAAKLEQAVGKNPPTEAYGSGEGGLTAKSSGRAASAGPARANSRPAGGRTETKSGPGLAAALAQGGTSVNDDPPAIQSLERRYKFLGRLGQGGNGVVYRAVDRALGRNVVVKFLHQALLPTEVARKYFEREAKTAAGLSHQNIVTIYDVGEEGETLYFSMELVEGRTLADIIVDGGGRLGHAEVLPIMKQLCSALEYAHGKQVIHRDIKPGNIMVTDGGLVKLLDFGLAKALDENPDKSVFLCGTPFYMSPEQIKRDFLDHRTDIYSVGCLLYVMYTGDVPFPEGNVFFHQQNTEAPNPDTLVPGLPKGVAQVLMKCVAKDRSQRYQRAVDVAAALAACK